MSEVPFKNLYKLKKVSPTDARSCTICFKSTPSVLITVNNTKDWFYICESHLTDKNFCSVVYVEDGSLSNKQAEYAELKNKETDVLKKIKHIEGLIEVKGGQFNKLKDYLWSSKKSTDVKDDTDEGKGHDKKDDEKETKANDEFKNEVKESDMTLGQLTKRLKTLQTIELKNSIDNINSFEKKFKKYQLALVFYRGRLNLWIKRLKKAEIEKSLRDGSLFPSLDSLSSLDKKNEQAKQP